MRFAVAAVAFVAAFHVYSVGNDCFVEAGDDGPALWSVAAKKAVEQSVGTPLDELWKDVYDVVVRQKGSRALRRLRYRVNEQMWDKLTMELYYFLKDWWDSTPENPVEAADMGSWQALVNLYKDILGPAMRGSDRVKAMNELLLDQNLDSIKSWVGEWRGFPKKRKSPKVAPRPVESTSEAETSDS